MYFRVSTVMICNICEYLFCFFDKMIPKFCLLCVSHVPVCSSMYFDEDGDVAHEFYEEVPPLRRGVKATMRRILTNLTPQVSGVCVSKK